MTLQQLTNLLPNLEVECFCSPSSDIDWANLQKGDIHCVLYKKKGEDKTFCHLVQLAGYPVYFSYARMGFPTFQSKL